MVVQYGITLAVSIISAHFGEVVAKVCDCLLHKGSLTLHEIIRFVELPSPQVKNCLLVLIQHNSVQAFAIEKEGSGVGARVITHYTAIFENILHRLRFSKFLAIASEELGKECEELLEGLLQHGRLTLEQIILRAISKQNEGNSTNQDTLRASFVRLVNSRYVEHCPASEPFLSLANEEEAPRKRGTKSTKLTGEIETIEQQAMTAAAPLQAERFSIIIDTGSDVTSDAKTRVNLPNIMLGEKRKHEALELDSATMATVCEKDVLWRANFEEFVHHLRQKACVSNVRSRLDDGASIVLNAMLEATRRTEKKIKIENSVPLTIDAIFEEVMKSKEGRSMTLDHVRAALSQLGCNPNLREGEETFSVDIKNIIEIARDEEVESVVLKRYGRDAYRMFRLLSKSSHFVETDKVCDMVFVERKVALKILYNLWKDDYLHMEKVSTHGSTQPHFLLWKVNKHFVNERILAEMYHAAVNLTTRMAYELGKEHEILQLPKEKRIGGQGKRFDRIRKVKILLDSSLMKLDDALMLFYYV